MSLRAGRSHAVALAVIACSVIVARGARAQAEAPEGPQRTPPIVRIGKWAALGLAAGMITAGAVVHDRADGHYDDLLAYCRANGPCPLDASGRYSNAGPEALYQLVVRDDRSARRWLIGGQAALLASAALWVLELSRKGGPENIPFSPYVVAGKGWAAAGFRLGW